MRDAREANRNEEPEPVPAGFKRFSIEDLGDVLNHQRVPLSTLERTKRQGPYPYYGASGVVDHIDAFLFEGDHVLISEDGENLSSRKTPIAFKANGKFWVNNHAHVIKCRSSALSDLLIYCFANLDLNQFISGAAQPKLNKANLLSIPIILPKEEEEQAQLATILTSFDDKIDLLRRQNQTLEAMAETLFRQWFLEEPAPTWGQRPLSSIATFLNGLACQKYPPANEVDKLPVLKIRELSSGITEGCDWASSQVKPAYIVEAGDVIFAWSASLMVKVWDGDRCVLNQHLFKVTSEEFPKWFYLRWCKYHLAEFIAISASHATTMGHIKRGDLDAAMVLVPSPDELQDMTAQMAPLLHKQMEIARQRRTLESLRDSLLPKLMSGEVRVAC